MKIKDLPFGVIWQLCMYLDRIDQPQQNWKAVLASVSGEYGMYMYVTRLTCTVCTFPPVGAGGNLMLYSPVEGIPETLEKHPS